MRKKIDEKNQAVVLRQQGYSYKEIAEKLLVSKGSLSLWLRSVQIDEHAQQRIQGRIEKNRLKLIEYNNSLTQEDRQKKSQEMKRWIQSLPEEKRQKRLDFFLNTVIPASQRIFTADELQAKEKLDKLFQTDLQKEIIPEKRIVLDFADKRLVIELTRDTGKGTRSALDRLAKIDDGRGKIIICPSYGFGSKRRSLLSDGYHWPVELFDSGIIPSYLTQLSPLTVSEWVVDEG